MNMPGYIETIGQELHRSDPITHNYMRNRMVYLFEEVDHEAAKSVIAQLALLDERNHSDIYLMINSPGGTVSDGLAIYDFMKGIRSPVNTVVTGLAASMAAVLAAAGVRRYATPSSEIMIHQPLGGVQGQATDISIVADHVQSVKKKLTDILAVASGKTFEELARDMERDRWMSAEEALEYGLIDHIGIPEWV